MTAIDKAGVQLSEVDYDPFAEPELARAVPTTDPQREVWLADQIGQDASLAYNEAIVLSIDGGLDVRLLQESLALLADRHESLRATFSGDGQMMLIEPRGSLQADVVDLTDRKDVEQRAELLRLESDAVTRPFCLSQGPLIRASLIRLTNLRHALLLAAHHIVCDGWSFGVLCRELMAIYAARQAGLQPDIPPHADSFGDYALARRSGEQSAKVAKDERYWISQFESAVPTLDLPTDRPRGSSRSFASSRVDLRLEPGLVEAARKLGASNGVSLFATLFGLFSALMARLGGDGEAVVGVPAAGQAEEDQLSLVGHCVHLLPVRISADGQQTVKALLEEVGGRVLDAYDHQACTFGHLLSKLNIGREAGRLPLVSVQFNLDAPIAEQELSKGGLTVSLRTVPRAYENFELFVNAVQTQGAIDLECQYNTGLFDQETVQRWLTLYRAVISRAVANPLQPLSVLFGATEEDRQRLDEWNVTRREYPKDVRVEGLVSQQARRTPNAVAIRMAGRSITYGELDQRANGLALALVKNGVGSGHRVGMACGRNEYMLIALLGILKAGAAYVPLDPSFPADRLLHMQQDAGLRWIVSDHSVSFTAQPGGSVMLVEDVALPAEQGPDLSGNTAGAAYVIYTSGSTGLPKGVEVPHMAVVNFLHAMASEPGLRQDDRLLAVTTISFDIAVLELFLPLMVGAEIVLADRDTVMDGAALRRLIESHQVNVLQATPSGWRVLLDAGWMGGEHFKALVGGEALPDDLANQLCQRTAEVWNMYGPTETTVWSTCWRVPAKRMGMRIGGPIANTVVRVLDDSQQECPIGVPGEIYIGGDGVASGYVNRPDLTAERFLVLADLSAARLYRTGDRGRWRNDGTLEHLGRLDHQIKLRGYRIELGEIEVRLSEHESVSRAVVVTREDEPGDVRLVAYVVMSRSGALDEAELLEFLRKTLPQYMVPSHVVELDAIPLLPNGKINRRALPRPEGKARTQSDRVPPSNETEARVLAAIEQVLNLPDLSISDDFFALGGHSLLAAKLTARLNSEFGLSFPLKSIFEAPSAQQFARLVDVALRSGSQGVAKVTHQLNQSEAPLTVMQERIRFMEHMYPGRVVYNTPSAHRLRGPFDPEAFECALNGMIRHQPSLRTYIAQDSGGQFVQKVLPQLHFELVLEDLSQLGSAEREAELMRRIQAVVDQPMDIGQVPLFRAGLYRLANDEHVFLFMPHHIVWDGWSFDLVYEELSRLYQAALQGQKVDLPALTTTYLDFAVWQREWLAGSDCANQVAYWKHRFTSMSAAKALPTDRPRRPGMTGLGAVEWVHVDKSLTEQLRRISVELGVTVNMLVMGVYAGMLSEALNSPFLTLGVPVRGRLNTDFEPIMGFFNNLLPISLQVDHSVRLPAWVASIKNDMLDALAHQDVPFERLASEPEIARHASKVGLYQSLYSFQDARERQRNWGPLAHSSVLVMQKGATEDFGLWLMEVPSGLEGGFNYNADLFDSSTAVAFRERLLDLLERVANSPDQTLQALLEADTERSRAFRAWVDSHHLQADRPTQAGDQSVESRLTAVNVPDLKALESALAGIWASLLGIDASSITRKDNFFDLGGNSLLVMHAVTKAQSELKLQTDPRNYLNMNLGQLLERALQNGLVQGQGGELLAATKSDKVDSEGSSQRGLLAKLFGRRKA